MARRVIGAALGLLVVGIAMQVVSGRDHAPASDPSPQASDVVWSFRPSSLSQMVQRSTTVVVATVSEVDQGPALAQGAPSQRVPTQAVSLETDEAVVGSTPSSFTLLKTASNDFFLRGDPPYSVGERYLLFLQPHGQDALFVPTAPDGRISVGSDGALHSLVHGPVESQIRGKNLDEVTKEIIG